MHKLHTEYCTEFGTKTAETLARHTNIYILVLTIHHTFIHPLRTHARAQSIVFDINLWMPDLRTTQFVYIYLYTLLLVQVSYSPSVFLLVSSFLFLDAYVVNWLIFKSVHDHFELMLNFDNINRRYFTMVLTPDSITFSKHRGERKCCVNFIWCLFFEWNLIKSTSKLK